MDVDGPIKKVDQTLKKDRVPDEMRKRVIGIAKDMNGRMSPKQRLGWAQCQVFSALGNAVNNAKALDFDSCLMAGFDPQEYFRILKLPPNVVLGYKVNKPMLKMRFPKEDILL
jgi:nitroreductase